MTYREPTDWPDIARVNHQMRRDMLQDAVTRGRNRNLTIRQTAALIGIDANNFSTACKRFGVDRSGLLREYDK